VELTAVALDMAGSFASAVSGFTDHPSADDRRQRALRLVDQLTASHATRDRSNDPARSVRHIERYRIVSARRKTARANAADCPAKCGMASENAEAGSSGGRLLPGTTRDAASVC
jgi:hypothetical protein